jgi:hypothetical protein
MVIFEERPKGASYVLAQGRECHVRKQWVSKPLDRNRLRCLRNSEKVSAAVEERRVPCRILQSDSMYLKGTFYILHNR